MLSNRLHKCAWHKVNWDSSVKICVLVYRNTAAGIMSSSTRYTLTVSHILCWNSLPALHQLAPLSLLHRWGYWSSYTANAWRLNTEHSATPAGDMQSVTAVITHLGWFIAGFDLERPVHTSVRNFVDLFYKQTNWQIPLILQSKTINNYVYPKRSMQIRCYIKNSWSAH